MLLESVSVFLFRFHLAFVLIGIRMEWWMRIVLMEIYCNSYQLYPMIPLMYKIVNLVIVSNKEAKRIEQKQKKKQNKKNMNYSNKTYHLFE